MYKDSWLEITCFFPSLPPLVDFFLNLSTHNYLSHHSPLCWENFLLMVLLMRHASVKLEGLEDRGINSGDRLFCFLIRVSRISMQLKLIPTYDTVLVTSVPPLPACGQCSSFLLCPLLPCHQQIIPYCSPDELSLFSPLCFVHVTFSVWPTVLAPPRLWSRSPVSVGSSAQAAVDP